MSRALLIIDSHGFEAHVKPKNLHGEYVVRFFQDGEHLSEADYFTDDKADAIGTARASVDHFVSGIYA